ncbi:uncharacterized protein Tco_0414679 [Tanacetum coccineum]
MIRLRSREKNGVAKDDRIKKGKLRISCPCQDCNNILTYIDSDEIKGHLISTGFVERYTCWSWHDELLPEHDTDDSDHSEDDDNDSYDSGHDNLDDMLHDLEGEIDEDNHAKFQELFVDAEKPLYDGCKKFTKLSAVLRLFDVKAANGYKVCPVCEDDTHSKWLPNCRKMVYMGHRRSLRKNHPYRKRKKLFDGNNELGVLRQPLDGEAVLSRVRDHLQVRHCLDVMHIEKNVCDSLIGLLLNISGKTKDGINVRKDMVEMGIRPELAPVESEGRYSSNIKKLVSINDLKLLGMKSHDCHILITQLIPIAIRGILPDRIRHTITKLCLFFNMIHSKVIDPEVLDEWQSDIILTLCQLEMYFPSSFFDVMVHLVSHIVREIKACGPTFLRDMYPFERYMGFLKGHVRNRYRPEASIIQGYATEEVIEFCTDYMKDVPSIGVPQSRHEGRLQGVGTIGRNMEPPNQDDLHRAHFTVLEHMTCVAPFIHEHKTMLIAKNSNKTQAWLATEHYRTFPDWLKNKQQDEKSTLQNSGVTLIAATHEFLMSDHEARSTIGKKKSYYGVIQEIWELDYLSFTIPMLKCKWVNNQGGVKVDDYGFTSVNLSTNGYASEPFILAKQANQIVFVEDPSDSRWHIVLHGKRRIVGVENVVDEDEYNQFDELPPFSIGASS